MKNPLLKQANRIAPIVAGVALLSMLAFGRIDPQSLPGVTEYHQSVAKAIDSIPYRIGNWIGTDIEAPRDAVKLLRPNRLLQRDYVDPATRERFSLLVVHCASLDDMIGHYPPICYPAHGWRKDEDQGVRETTFELDGMRFPARNYRFYRLISSTRQDMNVFSFFVLPDGRIVSDMERLREVAGNRARAQFGAAQVQIVGGEHLPPDVRAEKMEEFVQAIEKVLRTVGSGVHS